MSRDIDGVRCPKCGQETLEILTRHTFVAAGIKCRRRSCGWENFWLYSGAGLVEQKTDVDLVLNANPKFMYTLLSKAKECQKYRKKERG
jgi:hypothetical protein